MSDEAICNSVLVVSCVEGELISFLNGICSETNYISKEQEDVDSQTCTSICEASRRFEICNKYYSAQICLISRTDIPTRSTSDKFEACVLSFDSTFEKSFESVKSWFGFVDKLEIPPSTRLILDICTTIENNDHDARKQNILNWCVDNEVELIDSISNDDDDDYEVSGFKRIHQALSAHVWPKMNMKQLSNPNPLIPLLANHDVNVDIQVKNNYEEPYVDDDDTSSDHSIPYMELIDHTIDAKTNEGIDDETFGTLFENMRTMKENAESLAPDDRKAYAEKVALAFWKAMEGDEDEIDGL